MSGPVCVECGNDIGGGEEDCAPCAAYRLGLSTVFTATREAWGEFAAMKALLADVWVRLAMARGALSTLAVVRGLSTDEDMDIDCSHVLASTAIDVDLTDAEIDAARERLSHVEAVRAARMGAKNSCVMACSRCGEIITASYQAGRCFSDQCEPAEMDEHDEAEPWAIVHGDACGDCYDAVSGGGAGCEKHVVRGRPVP